MALREHRAAGADQDRGIAESLDMMPVIEELWSPWKLFGPPFFCHILGLRTKQILVMVFMSL